MVLFSGPAVTRVNLSSTMIPNLTSPINVMNRPMPTAIAEIKEGGIASTRRFLNPSNVSTRKKRPERKTAPRAVCQLIRPDSISEAKNALSPMPGAMAIGAFANMPTMSVAMPVAMQVAAVRACLSIRSIPDISIASRLRMDGLTKMM